MHFFQRLIFVFLVELVFTFNLCYAQDEQIKYSLGPRCNGIEVNCSLNEKAVCLELNSALHFSNGEDNSKEVFEPSCKNSSRPTCISKDDIEAPSTFVVECIELAKCNIDENNNKTAECPSGKNAGCLGNGNELNGCDCSYGETVCEYSGWEISDSNSYKL